MQTKVIPIRYIWAASYCGMTLIKGEKNILIDTAFRDASFGQSDELAILVLIGAGYAYVTVNVAHKNLLWCH